MATKAKKDSAVGGFIKKPKVKRAGIHAKTKQSNNKNSKLYKKISVGQG
jgi:hypothetical protein